jgi:uncharacterized protein (TIGR02596 family)
MEHSIIRRRAFTLLELLVVMAVAGILLSLVLPVFQSMGDAAKIKQAASCVVDQIDAARQWAEVNGATVQVRLLMAPGQSNYTGIQIWSGDEKLILDKPVGLPEGVAIVADPSLSPMLDRMCTGEMPGTESSHSESRWAGGRFAAFRVRPSGAIELAPPSSSTPRSRVYSSNPRSELYFTVAPDRPTGGEVPANYATIQLNPDTAHPLLYRP